MGIFEWVWLVIGFFGGIFLWGNIIGSLFAAIPIRKELIKRGIPINMDWKTIILPVIFAAAVLTLFAIFLRHFFYGSLVSGLFMFTMIGKLQQEEIGKQMDKVDRMTKL